VKLENFEQVVQCQFRLLWITLSDLPMEQILEEKLSKGKETSFHKISKQNCFDIIA
jgi:hypothetical protein